MLLYEKADGHIYGTEGNIPSASDVQITYKKNDGTAVTLTKTSPLKDDGKGGMNLNGERVVAWMGNVSVIPKGVTPPVTTTASAEAPKRVEVKVEEPAKEIIPEVEIEAEPEIDTKSQTVKKFERKYEKNA